jgi:hypothetical protein
VADQKPNSDPSWSEALKEGFLPVGRAVSTMVVIALAVGVMSLVTETLPDYYKRWSFDRAVDKAEAKAARKSAVKLEMIRRSLSRESSEAKRRFLFPIAEAVHSESPKGTSVDRLLPLAQGRLQDRLRERFRHYDITYEEAPQVAKMADEHYSTELRKQVEMPMLIEDLVNEAAKEWENADSK